MTTTHAITAATLSSGAVLVAFHSLATLLAIVLPPAIVFVSSLIVGLTEYPTTKSVLDVILRVLNFTSLLVHSNSPGTWKAPLVQSKPPAGVSAVRPAIGLTTGGAITVLLAALSFTACAHVPKIATQLVQCGEQGIEAQLPSLASQATQILTGTNPDWQNALDALLAAAGDAAGCAVQVAVADLEHGAAVGTVAETAVIRGQVWLRAQPKIYRAP